MAAEPASAMGVATFLSGPIDSYIDPPIGNYNLPKRQTTCIDCSAVHALCDSKSATPCPQFATCHSPETLLQTSLRGNKSQSPCQKVRHHSTTSTPQPKRNSQGWTGVRAARGVATISQEITSPFLLHDPRPHTAGARFSR
jgi:hypothetical protein